MITVEQACEIATRESGLPYVLGTVSDVGYGYVMDVSSSEIPIPGPATFVDKETGATDAYVLPDEAQSAHVPVVRHCRGGVLVSVHCGRCARGGRQPVVVDGLHGVHGVLGAAAYARYPAADRACVRAEEARGRMQGA